MDNLRVYLRALEPDDYKIIHEYRQDDAIAYGYGGIKYFTSSEYDKKWVMDRIFDSEISSAVICLKETNEVIGYCCLRCIDMHNRTGRCPIYLGEKYRGKGLTSEARFLILKYAFYDRGLNRIYAEILEDNTPSIKMHLKDGFKEEGLMRKHLFKDGEFKNVIVLGLLKEEFDQQYSHLLNSSK